MTHADPYLFRDRLDGLLDDLRRDLDDPGRLVVSHLFFQTWGRKP